METEETNYSQIRRDFYTKYKKELVPFLICFEKRRKSKLALALTAVILCTLVSLFLIFFISTAGNTAEENKGIGKLAIFIFVVGLLVWSFIKKGFENSIKKQIMPTICKLFGNMVWSSDFYEGAEVFQKSCVIPSYTSSTFDDIFTGVWKNVKFDIVESEYEIGSGKSRHTVFKGVVIKLAMNKSFISHTVISPNTLFHRSPSKDLRRTELEDPEFEKKYDVYTNDEVDARYLITTAFMERLNDMKVAFSASGVSCSFYDDNFYIALKTNKDLFSLCSLIKPIYDSKQYITMYDEIVSIIKLIEYFKLNQHIGL